VGFFSGLVPIWFGSFGAWGAEFGRIQFFSEENNSKSPSSWCTAYEDLLSTNQPFPQPIPLAEMVDFLVDIWHEEGLYD
ncbi:hypothetical protein Taro_011198, partial [Colocasia esculenta]|nr:hypothetical protein [Colocasia esculenta]